MCIREFLQKINRDFETTIILTTHDLKEIEELCKRLIIIDHGKILYDGNLNGLRNRYTLDRCVIFELIENLEFAELEKRLNFNGSVTIKKLDQLRVEVKFNRESLNPAEIIQKVVNEVQVHDISIEEPSIEEIVSRIYSKL